MRLTPILAGLYMTIPVSEANLYETARIPFLVLNNSGQECLTVTGELSAPFGILGIAVTGEP
jgi:hypothetical protein